MVCDAGKEVTMSAERLRMRARQDDKTTLGGYLEGTTERTSCGEYAAGTGFCFGGIGRAVQRGSSGGERKALVQDSVNFIQIGRGRSTRRLKGEEPSSAPI